MPPISSGSAAVSGGASGSSGAPANPVDGGDAVSQLLADGVDCREDTECTSGHCDDICCAPGAQCCHVATDCATQADGLGMSCDDRANCRGSAGKLTCRDSRCMTLEGVRNDTACTNRVPANECGFYLPVFCLGGELQSGAPDCATSCSDDTGCDLNAHCTDGRCVADLPNGERCQRDEDCAQPSCQNMQNGVGICCGSLGDCCKTPDDCPASYTQPPRCSDPTKCRGTQEIAACTAGICNTMVVTDNAACNGLPGPVCGLYQDVICMVGRGSSCKTSCNNNGDCDSNAFCDTTNDCLAKRANGQACVNRGDCVSENCINRMCCAVGFECCSEPADCTAGLMPACGDRCDGTHREPTCDASSICRYGNAVPDATACQGRTGGCGLFPNIQCDARDMAGMPVKCAETCTPGMANQCDQGATCMDTTCVRAMAAPANNGNGGNSAQAR